jgi:predicted ribosome quality control (RQC) complex YloA/Tae2 family protein
MGRYSNIILADGDMKIIDALRRINFDESTTRYILPGLKYVIQPQTKIPLDDKEKLKDILVPGVKTSVISEKTGGVSRETAAYIASFPNPFAKLEEILDTDNKDTYKPCLRYQNGVLTDYYVQPYRTLEGEYEFLPSINECLDKFFNLYDAAERKKAYTKNINNVLKRLQTKTERRIADNTEKLEKGKSAEKYKIYGDLILSNIYLIKKGDEKLDCFDYCNNKDVTIPLDSTLYPAQNAQAYFKKYTKSKHASEIAEEQLKSLYIQKEYLETIAVSVENCSLKQEFDEISNELESLSGLRKIPKKSRLREKPTKPTHFTVNGFDVYLGKNNIQNAEVTFEIGSGGDTWLHVKAHHGAHVIIKGSPDEETVAKCAQTAAYYSSARNSEKVEVDCTLRKYVKKIPSAMTGMVTYTNYRSVLVSPKDFTEISDKI